MNTLTIPAYNRRGTAICLAIFGLVALAVVFMPHITFAVDAPIGPDSDAESVLNLSPFIVTIILSSIVPLLNGFLTSLTTSSKAKALINLGLTTAVGVITVSTTSGGAAIISWDTVAASALSFLLAGSAYSHLYKPLEITSSPVTVVDNGALVTKPGKLAAVGVTSKDDVVV